MLLRPWADGVESRALVLVSQVHPIRLVRTVLLAGVAAIALSACAMNRPSTSMASADYSGLSQAQTQETLTQLGQRYQSNPYDKSTIIHYSAALRAAGQPDQAVAVLENAMSRYGNDADIRIAYAKALTSKGSFEQALNVINDTIQPDRPDWNALSVKGAILDQMGQNEAARQLYQQAQITAPQQASLEANIGLSYAMTNDLSQAEAHLRRAVSMPTATSQIRQNLALVLGLQGKFDEARSIYAQELPSQQVDSNMAYIRALITQQNRWEAIQSGG